jgi:hypothetical protein
MEEPGLRDTTKKRASDFRRLALFCVMALVGFGAVPLRARADSERWMDGVEILETADTTQLRVLLARPVRVLGASPSGETRLVEIRLDPGPGPRSEDLLIRDEEVLRIPVSAAGWLRSVRIEPQTGGTGLLVVRFIRPVAYKVAAEDDGAVIVLSVQKQAANALTPTASGPAPGNVGPDELLARADEAMKSGSYPLAIAYYTRLVEMPEGPYSPIALEYLGLARQRNGQRTHARGEYELYLSRYPDGEGAERVRQRLDALSSARQPRRTALTQTESRDRTQYDGYASLSTSYQRFEVFSDLSGAVLADSSQIFGVDMSGIAQRGDWDGRVRASGYYRYDYTGLESGLGSRVGYLNLDVRNRAKRVRGVVGRQSGRGGGVMGRFDGARLDVGITDQIDVGGVFGFPQVSSVNNSFDASRMFGGLRLVASNWLDHVSAEVYAIGQSADGLVDRIGIGTSLNYTGPLGYVSVDVDFDAYYADLNLAALSGSLAVSRTTWLRLYADYRAVPFFTTRNSLIGRQEWSLSQLEPLIGEAEIEELARQRTARLTTVTAGIDQQIGSRFRLMGDITGAAMTGTPSSAGVYATPATGWEFAYTAQLIASDLLLDGDSSRASFRIFDGRLYTGYTLWFSARYPILDQFQVTPLLVVGFRDQDQTRDVVSLDPGLQAQYRYRYLTFEADVRGTWRKAVGTGDPRPIEDQLGYALFLTVRLDI